MSGSNDEEMKFRGSVSLLVWVVFAAAIGACVWSVWLTAPTSGPWPPIATSIVAVSSIAVTVIIAWNQSADSKRDQKILTRINTLVVQISEQNANHEDETGSPEFGAVESRGNGSPNNSPAPNLEQPAPAKTGEVLPADDLRDLFIDALRSKGATLDFDNLEWEKKAVHVSSSPNPGWIVTSPDSEERWFVRRANGVTARPVMPKSYFQALHGEGVDLPQIRTEFQTKNHRLAAWYARTHSGDLWKISKSHKYPEQGPKAIRVDEV